MAHWVRGLAVKTGQVVPRTHLKAERGNRLCGNTNLFVVELIVFNVYLREKSLLNWTKGEI